VVQTLHKLKSLRQVTILMTTHESDEVLDLADRVILLQEGRIALSGLAEEVFTQPEAMEKAGVKPPALVHALVFCSQRAKAPLSFKDQELKSLTAARVSQQIGEWIREKRLNLNLQASMNPPALSASPSTRRTVIEARHLTYCYPGYPPVTALQDVSLSIHEGEFVGIIGQNGSGKSTLVKCFVGLLRPTQGEVRVLEEDIRKLSVGQMARRVGLVLQNPDYQLFTVSSREEILFGLRNLGIAPEEAQHRVDEALRWVNLESEAETFPFRLSFGDRRKLAVAATVALDPQVLILDEPTTAQDYRGRYQLAEIARRFREEKGRATIMITHDMELVAHYAERLIVMWNGQILLDGPTAEVFAQVELLSRTFLRPPLAAEIAQGLAEFGVPPGILTTGQLLGMLGGPA
jgi:energy-coupling factor transport system ATP-binding protein